MAGNISSKPPYPSNYVTLTNALCRGAIVLLCSHLEGYVESLGTIAITEIGRRSVLKSSLAGVFKYHLSRDLISQIKDTQNPERVVSRVEELFRRDGRVWDDSPRFHRSLQVGPFVGNFASPDHGNIKGFLRRFGFEQFEDDLRVRLKGKYQVCVNMVDQLVVQRNKIAHGDHLAYGTPSDVRDMYVFVKLYCRYTDVVVGNWFSMRGCPIRQGHPPDRTPQQTP